MRPINGIKLLFLLLNCMFVHTTNVQSDNDCTTPDSQPGTCVVIMECQKLYDLSLDNHRNDNDTKFLEDSQCDHEAMQSKVCCEFISHKSQQKSLAAQIKAGDQLSSDECGDSEPKSRIYGGTDAGLYEFPWMAVIGYEITSFGCVGSVITSRYVLTAAHCVGIAIIKLFGQPKYVRLGEYNITNAGIDCLKNAYGQVECNDEKLKIDIEKYILHPKYEYDFREDIALIRLSKAITYTDFIKPICLPTTDVTLELGSDAYFTVAGWGKIETKWKSDIKLKVDIPYIKQSECKKIYYNVWEKQICAGGVGGKNSCRGDSGGPLMTLSNTKRISVDGVVSYGKIDCGIKGIPGVYVKVFSYLNWIKENLKP